jgi:hypothetical protein
MYINIGGSEGFAPKMAATNIARFQGNNYSETDDIVRNM